MGAFPGVFPTVLLRTLVSQMSHMNTALTKQSGWIMHIVFTELAKKPYLQSTQRELYPSERTEIELSKLGFGQMHNILYPFSGKSCVGVGQV